MMCESGSPEHQAAPHHISADSVSCSQRSIGPGKCFVRTAATLTANGHASVFVWPEDWGWGAAAQLLFPDTFPWPTSLPAPATPPSQTPTWGHPPFPLPCPRDASKEEETGSMIFSLGNSLQINLLAYFLLLMHSVWKAEFSPRYRPAPIML